MNKMKKSFESYLNSVYSKKGQGYTHTRIGDNELSIKGGSYTICNLSEFYKKYIKHVFEDGKYEFLTEKQHTDSGPLLVDFDFRYDPSTDDRQHNIDDIMNIIQLYLQEIREILSVKEGVEFPVFIFEKETVNMLDNVTKDGIHMIIGIDMLRELQIILRENVMSNLKTVLEDLPLTNTIDEVLDEGITKGTTNWQLYGSRKPGNEAYMLKHHFVISMDDSEEWNIETQDIGTFDLKNNFKLLTAQYKGHVCFEMTEQVKSSYEKKKQSKKKKSSTKLKLVDKNKNFDLNDISNPEILGEVIERIMENIDSKDYNIKETHNYTMCLGESYYNPYDKWIRVGWALKNTDDRLFYTWMAFSSKSDKFDFDKIPEFYDMWCNFGKTDAGLTERSIIYWAKNDNFEKYKEIREESIDYYIEKTVENPTDFDFAMVLYQMYKDDFVCVSIKRDIWYIYENHRWVENEGGTSLRISISRDVYQMYFEKMNKYAKQLGSGTIDPSSEIGEAVKTKSRTLGDITAKLKQRGVKDNIMREAKEIFYVKDFMDKVDANANLLCFNNGVYDFESKHFRKGKPDDYISKSTNIDYIELKNNIHEKKIAEINDFMYKLFPEQELRDYMWQHLASTLIGKNNDQTFNIYNGCGSNGKSKLVELMSSCMGDYKATVPITLITAKRNSIGSTSSEVVQLKGVRYAVMQEPSKGDKINEGIMKEITGGDPLQGRALFKDSVTFIPQFKLVVCTNTLLDVGSNDEGTWRRICVCEFKSKFKKLSDFEHDVEDNGIMQPYQFELDKTLGEKFETWSPIFMSMLVNKACQTDGMVNVCDAVKSSSLSYRNTQDYYSEFITDKVKKSEGAFIKETSLYEVFKSWYQLHHGKNIPKGRDLFDYMNKRFGKKQRGKWPNVAIIYDDYDPTLDDDDDI
mgnify:CR=1 FL=1